MEDCGDDLVELLVFHQARDRSRLHQRFALGGVRGRGQGNDGVIAHYAAGGKGPLKAPELKPFTLSASETDDLVAFLESLTDPTFVTNPAFADPRARPTR